MAATEQAASKTLEAVVAPGRSVVDATGKTRRQGETAQLDPKEVKRLRALGFLLAKGEAAEASAGPAVSVSDGPTVRLA